MMNKKEIIKLAYLLAEKDNVTQSKKRDTVMGAAPEAELSFDDCVCVIEHDSRSSELLSELYGE